MVFVEDEVEKRSLRFISRAVFATALVFTVACGQSSSQTTPLPTNPAGDGSTKPINSNPPSDTRLPAWMGKAISFVLPTCSGTSNTCFQGQSLLGLIDIASNVLTPLVDTYFALELDSGRSSNARGVLHLGFEDDYGFWGADIPSFAGASTFQASQLDMIFSDSEVTFRLVATVVNDQMQNAQIHYRMRQSGETQCQATYYTCYVNYNDGRGNIESNACPTQAPTNNDINVCRNYMYINGTTVKKLGDVTGSFSQWIQ